MKIVVTLENEDVTFDNTNSLTLVARGDDYYLEDERGPVQNVTYVLGNAPHAELITTSESDLPVQRLRFWCGESTGTVQSSWKVASPRAATATIVGSPDASLFITGSLASVRANVVNSVGLELRREQSSLRRHASTPFRSAS